MGREMERIWEKCEETKKCPNILYKISLKTSIIQLKTSIGINQTNHVS